MLSCPRLLFLCLHLQIFSNQEVIDEILEKEPLNCFTVSGSLHQLQCCPLCARPMLMWSLNPHLALTGLPMRPTAVWTLSSFSSKRSLLLCSASVLIPTYTTAQEFTPKCFFFFFWCAFGLYLFSGAAPCRSAPPLLSFLLEVSTMTNSRLAGIYSAPVPGVTWADQPLLLAWFMLPADCWGPAAVCSPTPSLFNVKNRTLLCFFFSRGQEGMNIPGVDISGFRWSETTCGRLRQPDLCSRLSDGQLNEIVID